MAIQFAYRLALIACATALARGAIGGLDFRGTVQTALVVLAAFFGLGLVLGELARRVIEEHVQTEWRRRKSAQQSG